MNPSNSAPQATQGQPNCRMGMGAGQQCGRTPQYPQQFLTQTHQYQTIQSDHQQMQMGYSQQITPQMPPPFPMPTSTGVCSPYSGQFGPQQQQNQASGLLNLDLNLDEVG